VSISAQSIQGSKVRPRHRAASCLVACSALLISAALIAISLFLPPINLPDRLLARQYSPLNAGAPTIALEGELRLSLPPDQPATDFAVKLKRLTADEFKASDPDRPAWLAAARAGLPQFLQLVSPIYLIESRGAPPAALQIELKPPNAANAERLALYGWDEDVWRFIPSDAAAGVLLGAADFAPKALAGFQFLATRPLVLLSQEVSQDFDTEIAALGDIFSPAGLRPTRSGALIGSLAPGGDADAAYLFMPSIRNFSDPRALDIATVTSIISGPPLRADHIARITDLAEFNGFDGVFIDYRGLSFEHRAGFTRFITELAAGLAQAGLRLGVVVPVEPDADAPAGSGAYDWRRIGEAADYFQLPAIINPRAYAPGETVTDLLRKVTRRVAGNKVLLGMSARSVRDVNGLPSRIAWHDAFAALGDVIVIADAVSQTGSIEPGTVIRASLSGYSARFGHDDASQTGAID